MSRSSRPEQLGTEDHDGVETPFFADVDGADRSHRLLAAMDATARWSAVQDLRAWTEPAITRGDSLLDVGCGLADAAGAIAHTHPHIAVTGIDSSLEMLDSAGRRVRDLGADIALEQGDATSLPFGRGTFDAVRCERVLQWLEEPETAVREMVRVTAPGGTVALIDTDWRTYATTVADRGLEQRMAGPWATPHAGGFLRSYARAAGLGPSAAPGRSSTRRTTSPAMRPTACSPSTSTWSCRWPEASRAPMSSAIWGSSVGSRTMGPSRSR
ncbi:MAG: methyltransferase domain-containing protein [Actinomycetota bacterium]